MYIQRYIWRYIYIYVKYLVSGPPCVGPRTVLAMTIVSAATRRSLYSYR